MPMQVPEENLVQNDQNHENQALFHVEEAGAVHEDAMAAPATPVRLAASDHSRGSTWDRSTGSSGSSRQSD